MIARKSVLENTAVFSAITNTVFHTASLLPRVSVDAVLVTPGQNEWWRVTDAVKLWETLGARYLLVAGINGSENPEGLTTIAGFREKFGVVRQDGVISLQMCGYSVGECMNSTIHTGNQAEWAAEAFESFGIKTVALVVSAYHLPRAYCTILKACLIRSLKVAVLAHPSSMGPHIEIPTVDGGNAWHRMQGEHDRYFTYMDKGHVATFGQLQNYVSWLWDNIKPL